MKNVRITPISLMLAGLLTWLLWNIIDGSFLMSQLLYVLLLFVILVGADLSARVLIRDMKRIWIAELVFLTAVLIVAWIVRLWFV